MRPAAENKKCFKKAAVFLFSRKLPRRASIYAAFRGQGIRNRLPRKGTRTYYIGFFIIDVKYKDKK